MDQNTNCQGFRTQTMAPRGRLPIGSRIARYIVHSFLGAGGMGQVYGAKDEQLGRNVAIKLLPSGTNFQPEWVQRFTREARAASALNHPNIITVHESGECEAGCYIVMEMVEGRTLRQRIAEGISSEDALHFAGQIAKAIAAAHAAGIVHRDIKPDNIMVREDRYIKVLDFGLAHLPETDGEDSLAGRIVGTIRYMSPEQGQALSVGTPSDVFSLGLVFYEMFAGCHPFEAPTAAATYRAMLMGPVLPPSTLNTTLPSSLDELILTMLEQEPEQRPAAARIARVLQDLQSGVVVPLVRTSAGTALQLAKTVGRNQEQAELMSAADTAASGQGLLVCISGEAGLGKTTLVEAFLGSLRRDVPRLIGRGRCSQAAAGAEAHLPVLGALENLITSDPSGFVARTMRLLAPSWYSRVARGDESATLANAVAASPDRQKRELADLFKALAGQSRLMLVFEDIHWADDSTIDVMSFLSSQFDKLGLLLIVTCRESEVLPSKHPFLRLKLDLLARRRCREITLKFLTAVDAGRYVDLEFPDNRFPADFAGKIYARTQGHPLFLADLLRYLKDRGVINQQDGVWILSGAFSETENELPESVRSMVQRKMHFATEEDRRFLAAASIQGQQFDSAVLSKALDLDPLDVEERLEKLEAVHRFVQVGEEHDMPDGTLSCRYQFIHNLYQIAFYETLRPTRRSMLCGATARALLEFYGSRTSKIAARVAPLLAAAREWEQAARYYLDASNRAGYMFAFHEAAGLARRGIEAIRNVLPSSERSRSELALQLALGRPLALSGGVSESEAVACFARASELAREIGDDIEIFPAIFGLYVVSVMAGDCKAALTYSRQLEGIALKSGDPVTLAQAQHAMAFALETTGNMAEAERYAKLVLRAERLSNAQYTANFNVDPVIGSEWISARVLWMRGFPDQARAHVRATLERATQEETDLRSICYTIMIACILHQYCGDTTEVLGLAERGLEFCREHGFEVESQWFTFFEGWALFAVGGPRIVAGITMMRATMEFLQASGIRMFANCYAEIFAGTLVSRGEYHEALRWIDWALEFAERSGYRHLEPELRRRKAEVLAAEGDADGAQAQFRAALELAKVQGVRSLELRAAISQARFWQARGKPQQGQVFLSNVYGEFTEGFETEDLKAARTLLKSLDASGAIV